MCNFVQSGTPLLFAMSKNNIYFVSHITKNELFKMPNSWNYQITMNSDICSYKFRVWDPTNSTTKKAVDNLPRPEQVVYCKIFWTCQSNEILWCFLIILAVSPILWQINSIVMSFNLLIFASTFCDCPGTTGLALHI